MKEIKINTKIHTLIKYSFTFYDENAGKTEVKYLLTKINLKSYWREKQKHKLVILAKCKLKGRSGLVHWYVKYAANFSQIRRTLTSRRIIVTPSQFMWCKLKWKSLNDMINLYIWMTVYVFKYKIMSSFIAFIYMVLKFHVIN